MFNDDVAYDLGLSLESTYLLEFLHTQRNTTLFKTKIIKNEEWFSFNLVDLFKARKRVFEQIDQSKCDDEVYLKKLYNKNRSKYNRLFESELKKVLIKGETIKYKGGSNTYYKFNKTILTTLINGYPKVIDTEFTENEKLVIENTSMVEMPRSISTQLKDMDNEILKEAIEIAKENNISDYPYLKGIYNNLVKNKKALEEADQSNQGQEKNIDNSIICKSDKKYNYKNNGNENYKKTKFHNFEETFTKYSEEEFEDIALNQQCKHDNKEYVENTSNDEIELMAIKELQENTFLTVDINDSYWKDKIELKIEEIKHRK